MTYTWSITPPISTSYLSRNPRLLSTKAYTLTPNTYLLTLTAASDTWGTNASASVSLTVEPSLLIALLTAPSTIDTTTTSLTLDASASSDPDTPSDPLGNMTFAWDCLYQRTEVEGSQDCNLTTLVSNGTSPTLDVGPLDVAGYYTFKVTVMKDSRSSVATVYVLVSLEG